MVYQIDFGYLIQQQNIKIYKWYIIHTHSDLKLKLLIILRKRLERASDYFEDFLV